MARTVELVLITSLSLIGLAIAHSQHGNARSATAKPMFSAGMMEAMKRMDAGMTAAKFTGNPDQDFAAMMIPHHQGAIDMAKVELVYGRDPVLRRLAQGIIVEQQQEIELMQRSLQAASPGEK